MCGILSRTTQIGLEYQLHIFKEKELFWRRYVFFVVSCCVITFVFTDFFPFHFFASHLRELNQAFFSSGVNSSKEGGVT